MKTKDVIEELMRDAKDVNDKELKMLIQTIKDCGDDIKFIHLLAIAHHQGYNLGWHDAGGM